MPIELFDKVIIVSAASAGIGLAAPLVPGDHSWLQPL